MILTCVQTDGTERETKATSKSRQSLCILTLQNSKRFNEFPLKKSRSKTDHTERFEQFCKQNSGILMHCKLLPSCAQVPFIVDVCMGSHLI